ncbi:MAG: alpha-N-acetylglucosaminidase [Lachnospiraceae bacterium]
MLVLQLFLERILGGSATQVTYEICNSDVRFYEISGRKSEVHIKGSDVLCITSGVGHYLKYDLKQNLIWCGRRMDVPKELPAPTHYEQEIEQKYISYMNYCTFNYSTTWWDFKRWEEELDFMALNGVNLPLTCVGMEKVWYETLLEFDFTDSEIREFLVGPSYLAWQLMTNIESFAGPLPMSWIEKRYLLGKQILERLLEFGMQPIQQGFSGYVPTKLKEKIQNADIIIQPGWCGFKDTALLNPLDPLFHKFGTTLLQKQDALFGSYGFYATDPFHENELPIDSVEYLHDVSNAITTMFSAFDENYKWVLQSWSIRKDIINQAKKDKILILDIDGYRYERNDKFWGYEFLTGNLHNFAGRNVLHGDIRYLASNRYKILKDEGANIAGVGLYMEGIEHNPLYYDLAFEMLTYPNRMDLDWWLEEYSIRRYGLRDEKLIKAMQILKNTVYMSGTNGTEKSTIICARPALHVKKVGPNDGFLFPYGDKRLLWAFEYIYTSKSVSPGQFYDCIDILRQILSNQAYFAYQKVARAFLNQDLALLEESANVFYEYFDDLSELVSYNPNWRLKTFINQAKGCGDTEEEKELFAHNALRLITLWGDDEDPHIFDYCWKEWDGLIIEYYKKRWVMFIDVLKECLENDTEYDEVLLPKVWGREAFRANEFYEKLADFEVAFVNEKKIFHDKDNIKFTDYVDVLLDKYKKGIM